MTKANDMQFGGDHYKKMKIQPWDYIVANNLGWCEGNIIKYITRWRTKGGHEDLRKVQHYLDKLCEMEGLKDDRQEGDDGSGRSGGRLACIPSAIHDRVRSANIQDRGVVYGHLPPYYGAGGDAGSTDGSIRSNAQLVHANRPGLAGEAGG